MTQIVESRCVTRIGYGHSGLQQIAREEKPGAHEIFVRRHSDELAEYARKSKWTHCDCGCEKCKRVLGRWIGIDELACCADSLRIPLELLRAI